MGWGGTCMSWSWNDRVGRELKGHSVLLAPEMVPSTDCYCYLMLVCSGVGCA